MAKPKTRTTDIRSLIKLVDKGKSFYPTYIFSGKTFQKQDVTGPNVTAHNP